LFHRNVIGGGTRRPVSSGAEPIVTRHLYADILDIQAYAGSAGLGLVKRRANSYISIHTLSICNIICYNM
jgi:hypothetical protein